MARSPVLAEATAVAVGYYVSTASGEAVAAGVPELVARQGAGNLPVGVGSSRLVKRAHLFAVVAAELAQELDEVAACVDDEEGAG